MIQRKIDTYFPDRETHCSIFIESGNAMALSLKNGELVQSVKRIRPANKIRYSIWIIIHSDLWEVSVHKLPTDYNSPLSWSFKIWLRKLL